jgi:KUP system potassium uptake protein
MTDDPRSSQTLPPEEGEPEPIEPTGQRHGPRGPLLALAIAAIGIVYGDIGTSPLYTWNEVRRHGGIDSPEEILGTASLIFWTLSLIITGKYISVVLRAHNHGEGGTFALMGLLQAARGRAPGGLLAGALVFAAALLYGEGLLTPAISVLSAVEGLQVAEPALGPAVVPITLLILSGLFAVQHFGTARVGRIFGAVMVIWFLTISALGIGQIAQTPQILAALDPRHALHLLQLESLPTVVAILGSVVLCITGGEALYADLGHFGPRAIRTAWLALVYPALLLNYLGQGALLLGGRPVIQDNVFFSMVPGGLLYPMVGLATLATIVASQALISGAFSLTRSAINLGLFPRVNIVHTSTEVEGQIYLPAINWSLWAGCCLLVMEFGSSSSLAGAYGLAVTGVMATTSLSMYFVSTRVWGWRRRWAFLLFAGFGIIDLAYFLSNVVKLLHGGYVPLLIGAGLFLIMTTWRQGRAAIAEAFGRTERQTVGELIRAKAEGPQLPRAMVFLSSQRVMTEEDQCPLVVSSFLRRYGALPKHITIFAVAYEAEVPYYTGRRYEVSTFAQNVVAVRMHVGYMETPDVRKALADLRGRRLIRLHENRWTIVMGHEQILNGEQGPLRRLRVILFQTLLRFATQAHVHFGLGDDPGVSKEVIPVRIQDGHGAVVS